MFFIFCIFSTEPAKTYDIKAIIADDGLIDKKRADNHDEKAIGKKIIDYKDNIINFIPIPGDKHYFDFDNPESIKVQEIQKIEAPSYDEEHKLGCVIIMPSSKPITEVVFRFYGGGIDTGYDILGEELLSKVENGRMYVLCRLSDVTLGFTYSQEEFNALIEYEKYGLSVGDIKHQRKYSRDEIKQLHLDLIKIKEFIKQYIPNNVPVILRGASFAGYITFSAAVDNLDTNINQHFDGFIVNVPWIKLPIRHIPLLDKLIYKEPKSIESKYLYRVPLLNINKLEKPILVSFSLLDDLIHVSNAVDLYQFAKKENKLDLLNIIYYRKAGHYTGEGGDQEDRFIEYLKNIKNDNNEFIEYYKNFHKLATMYRGEILTKVFEKDYEDPSDGEKEDIKLLEIFTRYLTEDIKIWAKKEEGEKKPIYIQVLEKQKNKFKIDKKIDDDLIALAIKLFKEDEEKIIRYFSHFKDNDYTTVPDGFSFEEESKLRKILAMTYWLKENESYFFPGKEEYKKEIKEILHDPEIEELRKKLLATMMHQKITPEMRKEVAKRRLEKFEEEEKRKKEGALEQ